MNAVNAPLVAVFTDCAEHNANIYTVKFTVGNASPLIMQKFSESLEFSLKGKRYGKTAHGWNINRTVGLCALL